MKPSIIHRIQSIASTAILTLFLGISSMNAFAAPPVVSLDDARKALETDSSAIMIDIREPSEHANGVAKGAKLIPMSQLGRRLAELPKPGAEKFMVICATQNRSANIVQSTAANGLHQCQLCAWWYVWLIHAHGR